MHQTEVRILIFTLVRICCNRDFGGKEKCYFFPHRYFNTICCVWVVFELENVVVHGKIAGRID